MAYIDQYGIERNTEPVQVVILTRELELHGTVYLPKTGKDERRLSNMLNSQERNFLVLCDVTIYNRQKVLIENQPTPVIFVNIASIEILKTIEL